MISTRDQALDNYYREYPFHHYITLPEFIINKLNKSPRLLDTLPPENERTRETIYNWMKEMDFTIEELDWVGW